MGGFKQHYLHENKGSQSPARLVFYDCETQWTTKGDFQYHTMYLGWTYYVRKDLDADLGTGIWTYHDGPASFNRYIDGLYSNKTVVYLIGHNIFFDLQSSGFFRYFASREYRLSFLYDSGVTYILVVKKGSFTLKVISTTNFFAESLDRMGEAFGIRKSDIDFQRSSKEAISEYCKQDVKILVKTMQQWFAFIEKHDCGSFGLTRAAQSFRAYRHRFMQYHISVHQDETVVALERSAYFGGRNEAFFLGRVLPGPVFTYDVNSMYPSIMRDNYFPAQLIDYFDYPYLDQLPFLLKRFCAVAEILVDTSEPCYAVRHNGKLIFPVGRFRCFVTSVGLQYAVDHGHLVQCYRIALYKRYKLFQEYVDYFYPLKVAAKRSGDTPTEHMVKIFLNSLYGKFGQKMKVQTIEPDRSGTEYFRIDNYDSVAGTWDTETYMLGSVLRETDEINGRDSLVAIAAHITEYGRFVLYNALKTVTPGKLYYCDTDSLFTGEPLTGSGPVTVDPEALGAWKHEKTVKYLTVYGCKDYVADGTVVLKGVPKNAKQIRPGVFVYQQFLGQESHLRIAESSRFIVKRTVKVNKREYDKGTVDPSGYVRPFTVIGSTVFSD